MQEFTTRFTADISSHTRTMNAFKIQTCAAVESARKQLLQLGAVGLKFAGVKAAIADTIRLGAEMQNTRIAFEVMTGSAAKGNAILARLNKFADVTPFDNQEVIASGQVLLNCGTAVDSLESKLTVLGNIAAGTQNKLTEMVDIYAKAAAKGNVQAEELTQLSEHHVPILTALSGLLGTTTAEVMKLGEQGHLSFAILGEALESMGGKGGQYFGLMEKQSQSLQGKWDRLRASLSKMSVEIGERSIPGLTAAVEELLQKFNAFADSGELEAMIGAVSEAISQGATALRDFVNYVEGNRETIQTWGFGLAAIAAISKTRTLAADAGKELIEWGLNARATVDAATLRSAELEQAAAKRSADAVQAAAVRKAQASRALAKMEEFHAARRAARVARSHAADIAAAKAAANAKLSDSIDSGVPTRSAVEEAAVTDAAYRKARIAASKAAAREAVLRKEAKAEWAAMPRVVNPKSDADISFGARVNRIFSSATQQVESFGSSILGVVKSPLAALKMALSNIGTVSTVAFAGYELGRYIGKLLQLDKVVQDIHLRSMGKTSVEIADARSAGERPGAEFAKLDVSASKSRMKDITARKSVLERIIAGDKDKEAVEAAKKEMGKLQKEFDQHQRELDKFQAKVEEAQKNRKYYGYRFGADQKRERNALSLLRRSGEAIPEFDAETQKFIPRRVPPLYAPDGKVYQGDVIPFTATQQQYIKAVRDRRRSQKALEDATAIHNKAMAEKRKEEEKNSADALKNAEERLKKESTAEHKNKIEAEQKKLNRVRRTLADAEFRDKMSEKIELWRKEIDQYREAIRKTEKELSRFGLSVDEDILKKPEAIRRGHAEEILRAKIESYNKGETVTFTEAEKKRIAELRKQQLAARKTQQDIGGKERSIDHAGNDLRQRERTAGMLERADQRAELIAQKDSLTKAISELNNISKTLNDRLPKKG